VQGANRTRGNKIGWQLAQSAAWLSSLQVLYLTFDDSYYSADILHHLASACRLPRLQDLRLFQCFLDIEDCILLLETHAETLNTVWLRDVIFSDYDTLSGTLATDSSLSSTHHLLRLIGNGMPRLDNVVMDWPNHPNVHFLEFPGLIVNIELEEEDDGWMRVKLLNGFCLDSAAEIKHRMVEMLDYAVADL